MRVLCFILLWATSVCAQIPGDCRQAIVGIAKDWNSSHASLTLYEKKGESWQKTSNTWSVRLGKNGLAWGRGLHPAIKSSAPGKIEGDQRAPAGIFKVGAAYGYAREINRHPGLSYRQITTGDLWVEDPLSPHYNRHLVIENGPSTSWQQKAQMRQNDHAHSLKLYIGHNDAMLGGKPEPGKGSAIFFHIWRDDGKKATAGCTTMPEDMLKKLIARIDPDWSPVYVLLPQLEYQRLRKSWKLP